MASGDWSQGSTWQISFFLRVSRAAEKIGMQSRGRPSTNNILGFILLRASHCSLPAWPEDRYGPGAGRRGVHSAVCSAGRRVYFTDNVSHHRCRGTTPSMGTTKLTHPECIVSEYNNRCLAYGYAPSLKEFNSTKQSKAAEKIEFQSRGRLKCERRPQAFADTVSPVSRSEGIF